MATAHMYKTVFYVHALLLGSFSFSFSFASTWDLQIDLKGEWKFQIGDNLRWSELTYDDSQWDQLFAPAAWETQGFHSYDGYAWYRKKFVLSKEHSDENLYLSLGYIDDVDEVFVNGKLIGFSGSFPPYYQTAYNAFRRYPIPSEYLNPEGENTIAIRVYDDKVDGGIIAGVLGIVSNKEYDKLDVDLNGVWDFNLGDNLLWKEQKESATDWEKIMVPLFWEKQGFVNYDGYAWYRKVFYLPQNLNTDELILLLGMIDDFDQTFVNGVLIGSTGFDDNNQYVYNDDFAYQTIRKYTLPPNVLKFGDYNLLTIRVYDKYIDGGIYKGPIGIIRQRGYTDFWRSWWR
ncbi:beta galactosidase jelly roll domain-containing protein [Catalinimonas niigatensis]|uniref:beta galactosidase jelly roll domain-containing protein n=1 Tax=Catalinimonas niigatensis TaxID=1397264 RepID=UPI002665166C|nr:beta galactosidase jelly roll domain-containing protein [Catalinimonas niigatensis]WPP50806.1 beta galactosidase jelly roll domain-containing protein [Catalinimonas niigatensis]